MAGATIFNLLGGIGTFCVASNPMAWGPSMAKLASYQWLYVFLMIAAIVVSAWGIVVTIALARGKPHAYRDALIVLVDQHDSRRRADVRLDRAARQGRAAEHALLSHDARADRLSAAAFAAPLEADRRLCAQRKRDFATPAGLAAFLGGLIALTTPLWAGPTHIGPDGAQWVNVIRLPLLSGGSLLAFGGAALVWAANRRGRAVIAEDAGAEGQPVAGR